MIFIRCDSSTEIGTGHVFRCLALAQQLKSLGAQCQFVCRELPGHLGAFLRQEGWPVQIVADEKAAQDYLRQKASGAGPGKPWLIVDHYGLDEVWEKVLAFQFQIFVIDDLHNRRHHCQVLLDQNYHVNAKAAYEPLMSAPTYLFLGPHYSLLREEFRKKATQAATRSEGNLVLVFFGGGDPTGETQKFLQAVSETPNSCQWQVIVARSHPQKEQIQKMVLPSTVKLQVAPNNISELILSSQLYFGAGGTITWERMCLGLPGVIVSVADNQIEIAKDLAQLGVQKYLGQSSRVDYHKAIQEVESTLSHQFWLVEAAQKSRALVQPFSDLLLRAIFAPPQPTVQLRLATENEARFLFDLRNHPETKKMFRDQSDISWDQHLTWFRKCLATEGFRIYIGWIHGKPFGQFRVRADGDTSVSIEPHYRGQGLAQQLIQRGSEIYAQEFSSVTLEAKIKKGNEASMKSFLQAGYQLAQSVSLDGEEYENLVYEKGAR